MLTINDLINQFEIQGNIEIHVTKGDDIENVYHGEALSYRLKEKYKEMPIKYMFPVSVIINPTLQTTESYIVIEVDAEG